MSTEMYIPSTPIGGSVGGDGGGGGDSLSK